MNITQGRQPVDLLRWIERTTGPPLSEMSFWAEKAGQYVTVALMKLLGTLRVLFCIAFKHEQKVERVTVISGTALPTPDRWLKLSDHGQGWHMDEWSSNGRLQFEEKGIMTVATKNNSKRCRRRPQDDNHVYHYNRHFHAILLVRRVHLNIEKNIYQWKDFFWYTVFQKCISMLCNRCADHMITSQPSHWFKL